MVHPQEHYEKQGNSNQVRRCTFEPPEELIRISAGLPKFLEPEADEALHSGTVESPHCQLGCIFTAQVIQFGVR